MDIHYNIRMGEILPHIESFIVKKQANPCPPGIIEVLQHKLIADVSKNPNLREFTFPFRTCPIRVTIDILQEEPLEPSSK